MHLQFFRAVFPTSMLFKATTIPPALNNKTQHFMDFHLFLFSLKTKAQHTFLDGQELLLSPMKKNTSPTFFKIHFISSAKTPKLFLMMSMLTTYWTFACIYI